MRGMFAELAVLAVFHTVPHGTGGHIDRGIYIHKTGTILVEDHAVGSFVEGKAPHLAVFQADAVGVAAGEVVLVGVDEDVLALLVELDEALDLVLALGHLLHQAAVGIVEIEMLVAVTHRKPEELITLGGEHHGLAGFDVAGVGLLEEHFHEGTRRGVVLLEPHVVLLAVHLGNVDILLVRAPGHVSEVHLALVDSGVAAGVEVDKPPGGGLIDTHGHPVALHAGHGVLDGHHLGLAGFGVHQRVVHHHALVHAVEGQAIAVGRPEEAFINTKLVAVHALAEHHIVAVATLHQLALHSEVPVLHLNALTICQR